MSCKVYGACAGGEMTDVQEAIRDRSVEALGEIMMLLTPDEAPQPAIKTIHDYLVDSSEYTLATIRLGSQTATVTKQSVTTDEPILSLLQDGGWEAVVFTNTEWISKIDYAETISFGDLVSPSGSATSISGEPFVSPQPGESFPLVSAMGRTFQVTDMLDLANGTLFICSL